MFGVRSFIIASLAMVSGIAAAQFDGPAPLAWRWQQSSTVSPNGTPLVQGDTIFFNLGNRVYAIDRQTGNMKWKFPNGAPSPGIFRRSPILVNGLVCVYNDQKEIYGVNPATGEMKFVYQAPYPISSQIVGAGNNIAFSMDGGNIGSLDTATGQSAYIDKSGVDSPLRVLDGIRGPIYSDGRDVISFFDNRNVLEGISLSTRKQAWKQPFGATPADGSMTMAEGYYYVYTGAYMACLNASTGSVKWQTPVTDQMMFSPEVGGGLICAVSQSGKAYFYDMGGIPKSKTPVVLGSQPAVRPTCVGKKFIVPTANGSLQLVDPNGTVDWQYYVRPMNEAARQASSSSNSGKGAGGGPGFGAGGGPGAPGGPGFGGGQGGGQRGNNNTDNSPIVTVQVGASAAIAGHTLLVPAVDASLLAFDIDNGVDLIGPDVKQIWPGQGELVSGKNGQEFIFKIEDDASGVNISSVKLDIDGNPYHFDFGRDGYLICQISQTKRNPMITNGRHTMHIVAKDWMGNETNLSVSIRVDNALDPLKRPGSETTNGQGGNRGKGGGFGAGGNNGGGGPSGGG